MNFAIDFFLISILLLTTCYFLFRNSAVCGLPLLQFVLLKNLLLSLLSYIYNTLLAFLLGILCAVFARMYGFPTRFVAWFYSIVDTFKDLSDLVSCALARNLLLNLEIVSAWVWPLLQGMYHISEGLQLHLHEGSFYRHNWPWCQRRIFSLWLNVCDLDLKETW